MPRILIIEDEPAIADTIEYALRSDGFEPVCCGLGREGLAALRDGRFDLAILDVGLPDANGFDLCRELRGFSDVPVIFLTARADEIDRVVGLEIGADDYVTKPFSPRELVARVRVILRRGARGATNGAAEPLFRIDPAGSRVWFSGQALDLTRYETLLLKTLLAAPERVFSRLQLMQEVWAAPDHSLERTVDTHVKTLRAKLRVVRADLDPIRTHRGLGYSLTLAP
jgi:two-component system, OmpR family, catabolic regulation response regulator CreB